MKILFSYPFTAEEKLFYVWLPRKEVLMTPKMDLSLYIILLSCSLGRRVLPKKKYYIEDNRKFYVFKKAHCYRILRQLCAHKYLRPPFRGLLFGVGTCVSD
jgi:hypothetical protein